MRCSIRVWFKVVSHTLHSFGPLTTQTKGPISEWFLFASGYNSASELNGVAGRMGKSDIDRCNIKIME